MAVTTDNAPEEKSSIDNLAEGSLEDQLGEEPKSEESKEEAPKGDERIQQLLDKQAKFEQQLLERDQEVQFLRGYVSRQGDQQAPAPKDEIPKEFSFDAEKVTKHIEARGSEALVDLVKQ